MTSEIVLETERLVLSTWRPEQIDDLLALHGDPRVTQYLDAQGGVWTREKAQKALDRWADEFARERMGKLRVTLKTGDSFVGRAGYGLYTPTGEPEIGYAMLPEHWGKGYALEASIGLRDWIFRETRWDHFIGLADLRNEPSLSILRRLGMIETYQDTEPGGLFCQFFEYRRDMLNG